MLVQRTAGFAAALGTAAGFLGWGSSSSGSGKVVGFRAAAAGFLAGGGAVARGGGAPPALHFTVTFSKASLILALRMSAIPSMAALRGLSPTIFMR